MTQHSHHTAPTQFVDAAGVRFAYRRFGKSSGVSLVFNMNIIGTMDHWDPLVTDGLAATREVILFNNAGISNSSGPARETLIKMSVRAEPVGPERTYIITVRRMISAEVLK